MDQPATRSRSCPACGKRQLFIPEPEEDRAEAGQGRASGDRDEIPLQGVRARVEGEGGGPWQSGRGHGVLKSDTARELLS